MKPETQSPKPETINQNMKSETQSPKAEVQKSAEARVLLFTLNPKS
jgi:hypothetical protein